MVNRFFSHWTFWLLPGHCLLCAEDSQRPIDLCLHCEQSLPWLGHHCQRCAYPLAEPQTLCGQCQQQLPSFSRTVAAWSYRHPVDQLISQFKYRRQYSHGRVLGQLFAGVIQEHYRHQALPTLIVPTPLHWRRRFTRGFNQCEQLSLQLSKTLDVPLFHGLRRIRYGPPQQGLTAESRHSNLYQAFKVKPSKQLQGATIALVDDVMTTGATAQTISRALLEAGAAEVHVWCLARTPL